ncbi:hypothetical protein BV22DRAFT_1125171 [Leucogyrophana mollusca]|uniref:Uncharacterized protein n=1 Tax=Leucogyrophana mollusca TaxID=85980 RepID=A0ACB8BXU5_9AGAM|nr:hypothetical protein BV22DRAFT_1125171 [Leucogyrophana mollusca]
MLTLLAATAASAKDADVSKRSTSPWTLKLYAGVDYNSQGSGVLDENTFTGSLSSGGKSKCYTYENGLTDIESIQFTAGSSFTLHFYKSHGCTGVQSDNYGTFSDPNTVSSGQFYKLGGAMPESWQITRS